MLNTTFKKLHEAGACTSGYRKLAEHLGGVNKYGDEVTIPLSEILKSNGLDDAVWCLRATIEPAENYIIEFACRCAEHVLVNYEKLYPDDKRPRQAIEAARVCITDKSTHAAYAAADAAYAAYAAADAAADAAAHAAAYAAAYAATHAAADAAADAAYAAAYAATHAAADAAADAAYAADAAADAEKEWQKTILLEVLNMEKF